MKLAVIRSCVRLFATALTIGPAIAQSTQPVEWKASEGGNGHWYQINLILQSWGSARSAAEDRGGHLATVTSAAENSFLLQLTTGIAADFYLGGYRDQGRCDPGAWRWVTGEPFQYARWGNNAPDCIGWACQGSGQTCDTVVELLARPALGSQYGFWNDESTLVLWEGQLIAGESIIEWSADCNHDGLVDYGQILRGELVDADGDNIPDICESRIGVFPAFGSPTGGSPVTIIGSGFSQNPTVTFNGVQAASVTRVSSTQLAVTTPPGSFGPASVTVDGFASANAFVYLSACSSDLDQNGTVDAGDIALLLLDFGPCTEPSFALAAPAAAPPSMLERPLRTLNGPAQR